MLTIGTLSILVVLAQARPAPAAEKFRLDTAHSKIGFTATLAGVTDVEGRFTDADATIQYDEANLPRSTVTAVIKSASIDTADADRDRDLKSVAFFDVERFPTIRFQSARVEKRGDAWLLIGPLTMKGVTRTVEIPFVWRQRKAPDIWQNQRISFDGRLILNRKDYGILGPTFWNHAIGNAISIELKISAEIPNYAEWGFASPQGKKAIGDVILERIDRNGVEASLRSYSELAKDTATYHLAPGQLRLVGRKLLERGKKKEALAVLKLNAARYPDDSGTYDALGDALLENGERDAAVRAFRRALELDPNDTSAIESLRPPPA
jgi:polyisoprenoid-binding protein YceI